MKKFSGWGRTIFGFSRSVSVNSDTDFLCSVNGRGFLARGNGRSYGDSSINSGGVLFEQSRSRLLHIDPINAEAIVSGGVLIDDLERNALEFGLFPAVVPGTSKVTIGGAIASDIHGKSHHVTGSFSNYLLEITLLTSSAGILKLQPHGKTSKLFWATVGGLGLTGVILEARIKLLRVTTSYVLTQNLRTESLDETLSLLRAFDEVYDYTVAWLDLTGRFAGKGIVSGARHSTVEDLPLRKQSRPIVPLRQKHLRVPTIRNSKLVNSISIIVFNWIWYHKPIQNGLRPVQKYLHPLDSIENWNALYGPKGFIQYQFVVPFESSGFLRIVLDELKRVRLLSSMAVLKSLGEESESLIGFPAKGWTLAIDFPVGNPNLNKTLNLLDEWLIEAGGRVYLTKDSRMNSSCVERMYPRLAEWRAIKFEHDSSNTWQSDQGRRLKLC
jgi:decaprenylphospho-beta-D-ribofuranose 2-oxidase